jgi:hypothetical protein
LFRALKTPALAGAAARLNDRNCATRGRAVFFSAGRYCAPNWLIQFSGAVKRGTAAAFGRLLSIPIKDVRGAPMADTGRKEEGAGESQGGAYPNPHEGKEDGSGQDGFLGHGGQSDIGYEGPDNPNATASEQGDEDDER